MPRKKSTSEAGSALLVTIMMTSVVLLLAMILLERIMPYSKQIRGVQDTLQAYYTAKSELEFAKNDFQKKAIRENIDPSRRISPGTNKIIEINMPQIDTRNPGDYVIISNNTELPLQIRMFDTDSAPRGFGTSQKDPSFHSLTSFGGGMLFDLSRQDTISPPFSMITHTDSSNASIPSNIRVEFVYTDGSGSTPFFGTVGNDSITPTSLEGKNIANAHDSNREVGRDNLSYLMNLQNCKYGSCALKLHLTTTSTPVIPVAFSLSTPTPDLNAVIIADGLSNNGSYHARIVELIPLTQSI